MEKSKLEGGDGSDSDSDINDNGVHALGEDFCRLFFTIALHRSAVLDRSLIITI